MSSDKRQVYKKLRQISIECSDLAHNLINEDFDEDIYGQALEFVMHGIMAIYLSNIIAVNNITPLTAIAYFMDQAERYIVRLSPEETAAILKN